MGHITLESCHSRWVFDAERLRYRRVPQGSGVGVRMTVTEWSPYHALRLDPHSDSFVVVLNEARTRMLRSWRHRGGRLPPVQRYVDRGALGERHRAC